VHNNNYIPICTCGTISLKPRITGTGECSIIVHSDTFPNIHVFDYSNFFAMVKVQATIQQCLTKSATKQQAYLMYDDNVL